MCLDVVFVWPFMCLDVVCVLYLFDRLCVWMSFLFCICLTVHVFGCRLCFVFV